MSNPYAPFRAEWARESLTVITEHDEDRTLYHAYHRDEHLGAWPDPPRTEGPLKEPLDEDGRATRYRVTLGDGRELIVPSIAWVWGCVCPSRFAPGGGCVGCGWEEQTAAFARRAQAGAADGRGKGRRGRQPHETHAGGQSGGQQSLGLGGEE